MNLSGRIRKARLGAGLSQQEVADRLSVSQVTVSNWERGRVEPRAANLTALEALLGELTPDEDDTTAAVTVDGPSPFGVWLARTRQQSGLTRAQLSASSGISDVQIYNLETGRTENPQQRTRDRLTRALGAAPPDDAVAATQEAAEIEGVGQLTDFDPHDPDDLPEGPGVYVFYDISQRPIYVGESGDMAQRIRDHHDKFWFKSPIVASGSYIFVPVQRLRKQVEQVLIRFLKSNAVINKQHVER